MEKIVIACLGKYLYFIGIDLALVETETYGKSVVEKDVMKGGNYVKGKEGMNIIAEAISLLLFKQFKQERSNNYYFDELFEKLEDSIREAMGCLEDKDLTSFKLAWKQGKDLQEGIRTDFKLWQYSNLNNENIHYWTLFLNDIFPRLRDLTHSIRQGNWLLFISSVGRCITLFFAFGRTNYSRFVPLFLEDCLDLQRKHASLYKHYLQGGWVNCHTTRQGSAVAFDMALEKCYVTNQQTSQEV